MMPTDADLRASRNASSLKSPVKTASILQFRPKQNKQETGRERGHLCENALSNFCCLLPISSLDENLCLLYQSGRKTGVLHHDLSVSVKREMVNEFHSFCPNVPPNPRCHFHFKNPQCAFESNTVTSDSSFIKQVEKTCNFGVFLDTF